MYKFKTSAIRFASDGEVDWVLDGEFGGSRTQADITNQKERVSILLGKRA